MSVLNPNTWYRLFFSAFDLLTLQASDINGSGTASVGMALMGQDESDQGLDQWQPVPISTSSDGDVYAFRSRLLGNLSLFSVFQGDSDTRPCVRLADNDTDIPDYSQWLLTPEAGGSGRFYLSTVANGTGWSLDAYLYATDAAAMNLVDTSTNQSAAGSWAFISYAAVDTVASATSASSSATQTSVSSIITPSAPATATPSSGSSSAAAQTSSGSSLSTGATVGIALGSALAVILVAALAFLFYRKKKRAHRPVDTVAKPMEETSPPQPAYYEMPGQGQGAYHNPNDTKQPNLIQNPYELDGGSRPR